MLGQAAQQAAVEALMDDMSARSDHRARRTKLATLASFARVWDIDLFPPTRYALIAVGPSLKAGGYRSAGNYLAIYQGEAELRGHEFPAELIRLKKRIRVSCDRGKGGALKSLGLPLLRLHELNLRDDAPWQPDGPIGPACAITCGAWFMICLLYTSDAADE